MADEHDILTASEVAAWLRIAVSTVYDWAGKATIPSIRLNGCLRFDRQELTRWIAQARTGPARSRSASGFVCGRCSRWIRPAPGRSPT